MDTAWKIRSIFMCNNGVAKEGSFLFPCFCSSFPTTWGWPVGMIGPIWGLGSQQCQGDSKRLVLGRVKDVLWSFHVFLSREILETIFFRNRQDRNPPKSRKSSWDDSDRGSPRMISQKSRLSSISCVWKGLYCIYCLFLDAFKRLHTRKTSQSY